MTCLVAMVAMILPTLWFAYAMIKDKDLGKFAGVEALPMPAYAMHLNNYLVNWMNNSGLMFLGLWIALIVRGQWRPKPTWTDRAGCILGASFILSYLSSPIEFFITPISRLWEQ